jgi:hypothetical protein
MNRNKLNYEEISTSLEVLDRESLWGIKGGLTAAELLQDILKNGIANHTGRTYAFDGEWENGISYINKTL